jgi:acyl carrier protein
MENVKDQLKPLILSSLRITDMTPADLHDDQPLLGGDLEIDSIDILQLILEIERHFGIKLVDGEFDEKAWGSINSLSATIQSRIATKT